MDALFYIAIGDMGLITAKLPHLPNGVHKDVLLDN